MPATSLLLQRLGEIAHALSQDSTTLALIGLGSAGLESNRIDQYSDLDFFVIVEPGAKNGFLDGTDWLGAVAPVGYAFRNTADGYKLLFDDGVFCEFAVFEPGELANARFAPGRIIWKRPDVDEAIANPAVPVPRPVQRDTEWLVGEAVTNLFVGLCRFRRGEHLSAFRFVECYAVDRIVDLVTAGYPAADVDADPFSAERRFESRFPGLTGELAPLMQGYEAVPQSALAILAFLETRFDVNARIASAIRALARRPD